MRCKKSTRPTIQFHVSNQCISKYQGKQKWVRKELFLAIFPHNSRKQPLKEMSSKPNMVNPNPNIR